MSDESKTEIDNVCPYTVEELGERSERIMAVAFRRYNLGDDFVELDIDGENISSLYGDWNVIKMLIEMMVVVQELSRRCIATEARCDSLEHAFLNRER